MDRKDRQVDRFLAKVLETDTGCWEWQGAKTKEGYGKVRIYGKDRRAHRVIWQWYHGDIPPELQINHLCNNRACVNPAHLELVTHAGNQAYKIAQNRQPKGEANGQAKLTAAQVSEIRAKYAEGNTTHRKLAQEYGVDHATIGRVVRKEHWNSNL